MYPKQPGTVRGSMPPRLDGLTNFLCLPGSELPTAAQHPPLRFGLLQSRFRPYPENVTY